MITDNRTQHLGKVYRLVEQFELISRTDLAKLSELAPASITNLTKSLIDNHFISERAVQNSAGRGRPAVGLAVSNAYWQLLCLTISSHNLEITLCGLNGEAIFNHRYPFEEKLWLQTCPNLDDQLNYAIEHFTQLYPFDNHRLFAVSVSVLGKLNPEKTAITQLGSHPVQCEPVSILAKSFPQPILLNEHFTLWLLAESTLGGLINDDNVIFLKLDESVDLSILLKGALLHQQSRMNVDKMTMPRFALSDEIFPELPEIERYQLANQISFTAIAKLVDRYLPNDFHHIQHKIDYLCEQVQLNNPQALQILNHISDNLAYMLMNLLNIFSSEKIMFNSPLLQIQQPLFEQISPKLHGYLLRDDLDCQLVTSQLKWNSPLIPCSAIKQGIYDGELLKNYD